VILILILKIKYTKQLLDNKEAIIVKIELEDKGQILRLADFCLEKKAEDIVVLDLRDLSTLYDYFLICSGTSNQQVKAINEHLIKKSKAAGFKIHYYQREDDSGWMLLDYFNIVVHIFEKEIRKFYNLETLWSNAKKISIDK